jgi:hypothetical protein
VNTSSWQVFTHLPLNPKKSLCGTRLADTVSSAERQSRDSRPSSNSRFDNSFSLILIGRGLVCLLEHIRNAEEDVVLQVEGM